MVYNKKKLIIVIAVCVAAFFFYRHYRNRLNDNLGAVSEFAVGCVSTDTQGNHSTLYFFDDNLELIDKKKINVGSLSSEYSVPLRKGQEIYIPNTGEREREGISMVYFNGKTGEAKYYQDSEGFGMMDTIFNDKEKIYYTTNLNFDCAIYELNFSGEKENSASINNTLIGNGGVLGNEIFLITHSIASGDQEEDGTRIVFYNEGLEKLREYNTEEFVHRGPSIVYDDKIYFMSSNAGEEDNCIYSVDRNGNFEKIPLPYLVYRIEPISEGILIAGGDENQGGYILLKKDGEKIIFNMKETSLLQMKWHKNHLFTLDRDESKDETVIRKYNLRNNEMNLVAEKIVEISSKRQFARSIF